MADRPSKQFDRVASRQSLNSVLTNRAQSRDNLNHHENYLEQRNLHNMSFDTARDERDRRPSPAMQRVIDDGRTPLQSPLPKEESPKFTRPPVRHNGIQESDIDDRQYVDLHDSPRDRGRKSPRDDESERTSLDEIRRASPPGRRRSPPREADRRNPESARGVPTPLAAIVHSQRNRSESGEEDERSRYSSADSLDRRESRKPATAPKPIKNPKKLQNQRKP